MNTALFTAQNETLKMYDAIKAMESNIALNFAKYLAELNSEEMTKLINDTDWDSVVDDCDKVISIECDVTFATHWIVIVYIEDEREVHRQMTDNELRKWCECTIQW